MRISNTRLSRGFLLASLLLLAGCGSVAEGPVGDATNGQKLFSGELPIAGGNVPVCSMCHTVTAGESLVIGPNLSNIGNRAATTLKGMSAMEYLRSSVIDPDGYLAGGFQEGIHYRGYGQALTPQQLNDLIAYLITLKSGQNH